MQNIFLYNDYMTNKMIYFFKNKNLQKKALQYWEGTAQPLTFSQAIQKIIKHLIKS